MWWLEKELWRLWIGGNVKVEKDGGNAGPMRDSCVGVSIGGSGVDVAAAGHPPMEIGG